MNEELHARANAIPTAIRIPDDLKMWLKHQAVSNRRSLTQEVVIRLERDRDQQLYKEANHANS